MTTVRGTYTAGTPQVTTFEVQPTSPLGEAVVRSASRGHSSRVFENPEFQRYSRLKNGYGRVKVVLKNNSGMFLVASSQAFFSLMNVAVKKLNSLDTPVPAFELILVRMGITWLCCVTYMFLMKVPDPFMGPKGVRLLLVARGFVGFFGLFGVYYSLQFLSLSDATVLTFLAPMCTAVTGALLLKEKFSLREALAGLCSLCGVILIARPEFLFGRAAHDSLVVDVADDGVSAVAIVTPAQRLSAVGVALLGVCGATGAYTTIRAIGKRAHPLHNLVSFSSQCVIVATIAILVTHTPLVIPTKLDWLLMLLMIGIFGFIAQVLLTMGLQRETASRGSMAVYIQIIFATAFERIFFHSTPPPLSIIGTIIIMTSAIYVAVTKETSTTKGHPTTIDDISLEEGLLSNQEDTGSQSFEDMKDDASTCQINAPKMGEVVVDGSVDSCKIDIVVAGKSSEGNLP